MTIMKAWLAVECALELPDDDMQADMAFDDFTVACMTALAGAAIPGVLDGSWSLEDADTMRAA